MNIYVPHVCNHSSLMIGLGLVIVGIDGDPEHSLLGCSYCSLACRIQWCEARDTQRKRTAGRRRIDQDGSCVFSFNPYLPIL